MSMQLTCASVRLLLPAILILTTTHPHDLQGEDVVVTGCVGSGFGPCPPSCPEHLGTVSLHSSFSTAVPAGADRSRTMFGVTNTALWSVTPALGTNAGAYRVYVSMGATYNCSPDIHVKLVATSGCTLADTNFVPQTEIDTTAFQRGASLNVWTPVAVITNTSKTPTITFSYASGSTNRWYMDEVRFENLAGLPPPPARITEIRRGSPLTISGTGPASHSFALLSSTNPGRAMNLWVAEQTNSTGSGSFSFSLNPPTGAAKYFRVEMQ